MKSSFLLAVVFLFAIACKKEDSRPSEPQPSAEQLQQAVDFNALVLKHRYQPRDYYADQEIDYNDTDNVVKAEKNLWQYVSPWIVDDKISFIAGEKVAIEQGERRSPDDNSGLLERNYKIYATAKDGVVIEFVDHLYRPLKYYLVQMDNDFFIIYTLWGNKKVKVYSRFETVI